MEDDQTTFRGIGEFDFLCDKELSKARPVGDR